MINYVGTDSASSSSSSQMMSLIPAVPVAPYTAVHPPLPSVSDETPMLDAGVDAITRALQQL